jgi:hypothetical protein
MGPDDAKNAHHLASGMVLYMVHGLRYLCEQQCAESFVFDG